MDFGFWIGIIGVNLIFKPIINLKGDARILFPLVKRDARLPFTPYSPEAKGVGGRSGERKHPRAMREIRPHALFPMPYF